MLSTSCLHHTSSLKLLWLLCLKLGSAAICPTLQNAALHVSSYDILRGFTASKALASPFALYSLSLSVLLYSQCQTFCAIISAMIRYPSDVKCRPSYRCLGNRTEDPCRAQLTQAVGLDETSDKFTKKEGKPE